MKYSYVGKMPDKIKTYLKEDIYSKENQNMFSLLAVMEQCLKQ